MTRVRSAFLLVVAMVMATTAIPSRGAAEEPIPITASGEGTGNHWVVWKIHSPKVPVVANFIANGFGGNSMFTIAYYDSEYNFHTLSSFRDRRNYGEGVYVDGSLPEVGPVHIDMRADEKQYPGYEVRADWAINPPDSEVAPEDFTGYFLTFVLGKFESYSWEVRGATGSEIVVEEGNEGYLFNKEDIPTTFQAQAHKDLSAAADNYRVGGSAVYDANLQLTFDRVFIGAVEQGSAAAYEMTVDTPDGLKIVSGPTKSRIGLGWIYSWLYLVEDPAGNTPASKWINPDRDDISGSSWDRGRPGTYTFNATGGGAHVRVVGDQILVWAVVPRFPGLDTSK